MTKTSHNEMNALASQLRTHPDIAGLDYIEQKIEAVALNYAVAVPQTLRFFLSGMRAIRSDQDAQAIESYARCIESASDGDFVLTAISHLLTATLHYEQNRIPEASAHFKAALANEHRLDNGTLSWVLVNVSGFYCYLRQFQRALECANRGAELSSSSFSAYNYCVCLLNIGYSQTHMGNAKPAIESLEEAIRISEANDNVRLQAIAYSYIARAYVVNDPSDFSTPHQYFLKSRDNFSDALSTSDEIDNEIELARLFNLHNKFSHSIKLCDSILDRFHSQLQRVDKRKTLEALSFALENDQQWQRFAAVEKELRELVSYTLSEHEQVRNAQVVQEVDTAAEQQEQLINTKVFENLGAINAIGQMIATSDDLNQTLPLIYEQVTSVFPTHEFGIALYDANSSMLDYCYFYDSNGAVDRKRVDCRTAGNIGSFVVNNLQTVHINSVTRDSLSPFVKQDLSDVKNAHFQSGDVCHSILVTPILLKNELLGVLSLRTHEMNQYHSYHRRLFEQLANFIGISLNNVQQKASLLIANQQLEKLSRTDPLTGLRNRHQLSELFHKSIESAVLTDSTYVLGLIDIDHYKQFNDTYGHQVGDEALKVVANLLSTRFSDSNAHLFRYGGDEFLLLATGLDRSDLQQRLSQLLEECQRLHIDGVSTPITLSVGAAIACQPERATQFNLLFDLADEALYRVKHRGRNGFVVQSCQNEQLLCE